MKKIASYTITTDTGFAPNPFHGYCTLGACTPNHRNYRIEPGDWIVGISAVATGNRLIHAMLVRETLSHHDYFHDPRFEKKKPKRNGTWSQRAGDNIYYRDAMGRWKQYEKAVYHRGIDWTRYDTRYSKVFISREFYYFGESAPALPSWARGLVKRGRGLHYVYGPLADRFVEWLEKNRKPGRFGDPRDREPAACQPDSSPAGGC